MFIDVCNLCHMHIDLTAQDCLSYTFKKSSFSIHDNSPVLSCSFKTFTAIAHASYNVSQQEDLGGPKGVRPVTAASTTAEYTW